VNQVERAFREGAKECWEFCYGDQIENRCVDRWWASSTARAESKFTDELPKEEGQYWILRPGKQPEMCMFHFDHGDWGTCAETIDDAYNGKELLGAKWLRIELPEVAE